MAASRRSSVLNINMPVIMIAMIVMIAMVVVGDLMIDVDYLEFVFMDSSHLSVVYWWLV